MTDILEQARAIVEAEIMRQYKAHPEWDEAKDVVENIDCKTIASAILALAEPKWREIDEVTLDNACAAYESAFIFGDNNWRNQMRAALEAAFALPLPPKEEQ